MSALVFLVAYAGTLAARLADQISTLTMFWVILFCLLLQTAEWRKTSEWSKHDRYQVWFRVCVLSVSLIICRIVMSMHACLLRTVNSDKYEHFDRTVLNYKYSSPNLSLAEIAFLNQFWERMTNIYPVWLAPNVITLTGAFCMMIQYVSCLLVVLVRSAFLIVDN